MLRRRSSARWGATWRRPPTGSTAVEVGARPHRHHPRARTRSPSSSPGPGVAPGATSDRRRAPIPRPSTTSRSSTPIRPAGPNELAANEAAIQAQIRRNNALLNDQSLASGGPEADFKVRCDSDGEILVTAFPVLPNSDGEFDFSHVVSGAMDAGHRNPSVDYTIFYDGALVRRLRCRGPHLRRPAGSGERQQQRARLRGHLQTVLVHPHLDARERAQPGRGAVLAAELDRHRRPLQRARRHPLLRRRRRPQPDDGRLPGTARRHPLRLRLEHLLRLGAGAGRVAGEQLEHRLSRQPLHPLRRRQPVPPETSIAAAASATAFAFASSEEPATFECAVAAPGAIPSFTPCAATQAFDALPAGPWVVHARAVDPALNRDPTPATLAFTAEATGPEAAPETTITSGPADKLKVRRRAKVTFAFGAGEPDAEFLCRLDKTPVASLRLAAHLQAREAGQARVLGRRGRRRRQRRRQPGDGLVQVKRRR